MRAIVCSIAIVGAMCAGIFAAPMVHADPQCYGFCNQPTPPYNGPIQNTWDLWPLGGNGGQPIQCVPMSTCAPIVVNPNG